MIGDLPTPALPERIIDWPLTLIYLINKISSKIIKVVVVVKRDVIEIDYQLD